ncbi:type II toxin-antitoxin system HicA family toxin [Thaumasiovibrio subtropicus]|uniref:type II toxin-antitoxin system HicA family toxin n=1 Tax=Thaumasiovibrio subtropicus TaxID=1891207 RepID=UPI000B35E6A3|nr:type II toxin-antitoxin system HicA family toxin [Thaumasiovibrio subtropicus]
MKSRDLIKEVEAAGWVLVRVKGSHHQFKHPDHKLPLTIPHPKKDLGMGLVKAIKKQAGL